MQHRINIPSWIKMLGVAAGMSLFSMPAYALDTLIEGAKLCTRHLPHYEREYGIPTHLLSAIASTESGRYHEGLGIKIPWPWTVNAEGKGYYFDSKQEAIAAVRKLQLRGVQSVDVGCMQVNLMHHPQAFASLDEAFEPQHNIAYAASFLRNLYQENNSWKQAAADYHSKTPVLGREYVGQVYSSWYQILDKLRAAKMQVPESSVAEVNTAPAPYVRHVDSLVQEYTPPKKATPLPEQAGKKLPTFHTPHMNVIQLSKKSTERENGVIVVRPEIHTAAASEPVPAVVQPKPVVEIIPVSDAKVIRVDNASQSNSNNSNGKKTGPTFIFND